MLNLAELLVVLITVVLVFGVAWLPKLGEALGRARLNYKRASEGRADVDITPPGGSGRPEVEDAQIVGPKK